jgi:hypothetical protein
MMTPFPPKTPMQMRREAERRGKPQPKLRKPGQIDPAKRPQLDAGDWSAYVRTGAVPELS